MKKIAIVAALTAGFFTLAACSSDKADPDTVVESEAGDISKEEFYEELKDRYGEEVLNELVTTKVLEDNYDVEEEKIDEEVENVKDQLGDQFEMVLQQQGFEDEEAFRDVLRLSLLQEAALSEDVDIDDEEIEEQYERMKTEIKAQHILVDDKDTAKEVKEKIDDGEDFGELAEEYSTDEATNDDGGKLDYFTAGEMDPAFEDAAYDLKEGEVSDPVQSQHGFHIIKVNDKRETEEDIGSLEDNEEDIRRELINEKVDPIEAQEKISKLMEDAKVNVNIKEFEGLFDSDNAERKQ